MSEKTGRYSLSEGVLPNGQKLGGELVARVWRNPITGQILQGRTLAQAQTVSDISAIKAKVVMQEVLGLARPLYKLRPLCDGRAMPKLVQTFYTATQISASRKVPKGVEADINVQTYAKTDMDLWKNVGHVVIFDEDRMMADVDVFGIGREDAAKAISAAENLDIGDELKNATEMAAVGVWTTQTNRPLDDIGKAIAELAAGDATNNAEVSANATHLAFHPDVWNAFITHDKVVPLIDAGLLRVPIAGAQEGAISIPMWPDLRIVIDASLLRTSAFVVAANAPGVILGEGPTETAAYRNEPAGYDAFIIRQWVQPKLVSKNNPAGTAKTIGAREITGVLT